MLINNAYNKMEELKSQEQTLSAKEIKKKNKIYSRRPETALKKIERKIVKSIIYAFYKIVFRIKKENEQNVPTNEPIIICANHLNIWDAVGIVIFTKRPVRFIAKKEVFENSFANWLLHLFDAIPIRRGMRDLEAMKISLKALNDGEALGLFPEGTRKGLSKGAKIQNGAAYMAMKAKVKVVPVGIRGSFKPFTKVTISYGTPIDFTKYENKNPEKEDLSKATKDIMESIIMLTKQGK